jgi:hypothetical protein
MTEHEKLAEYERDLYRAERKAWREYMDNVTPVTRHEWMAARKTLMQWNLIHGNKGMRYNPAQ